MSFFIKKTNAIKKGVSMKSNKEKINEMLNHMKEVMMGCLDKVRSIKIPLPRLSASQTEQTTDKNTALKHKYSSTRSHGKLRHKKKNQAKNKKGNLVASERQTQDVRQITQHQQVQHIKQTSRGDSFKNRIRQVSKLKLSDIKLPQLPIPENVSKQINIKNAAIAVSILLAVLFTVNSTARVNAYAVEVDGKRIAVVAQKADAEKLFLSLKAEKARVWKRQVNIVQKLTFSNVAVKKHEIDNSITLKNKFNNNLKFLATATQIKVNGENAVVVKNNAAAAEVLLTLKNVFAKTELKNTTVVFQEKVELSDVPVALKDILPVDKAVKIIREGKEKQIVHTVKEGESLWTIARKNDMHVADLLKANPSIKGEHLDLDQKINLVAVEPIINVIVTGESMVKEKVAYKVEVEKNTSMWKGTEKVKIHGQNGQKEVTYKIATKNGMVVSKDVLKENVLKQAQNQVVIRGSKYVTVAYRGKGRVGWPISGKITSRYGRRWGGLHTGLDIDGYKGEPVGAAGTGVVTSAGWGGGYGKMVTIRHNNGIVTRYAHLSKISVSVGKKVDRGDLIGLVGSTGHSTGAHLHFEVINGGNFQNPMKYLK
jgi:murein DD-endopeptidase MepM/ murein hydrolase activator NlpD/nucleoid-associated protein YgaU